MKKRNMKVSVVIPTLCRDIDWLKKLLVSILDNTILPDEIILVTPRGLECDLNFFERRIVVVQQNGEGVANARNVGILNASGDIILFTDDDCIVPKRWIERVLDDFMKYDIAGVYGRSFPCNSKIGGYWKDINRIRYVRWGGGRNMAFLKKVLIDVGLFDSFISNEDVDIGLKITNKGYKIIYDPNLVVYHKERDNIIDIVKERIWYGRGKAQLFKVRKKLSAPFVLFASPFFILVLCLITFASLFYPPLIYPTIILNLIFIYLILKKHYFSFIHLPYAILFAYVSRISQMIGFFVGLVKDKKPRINNVAKI